MDIFPGHMSYSYMHRWGRPCWIAWLDPCSQNREHFRPARWQRRRNPLDTVEQEEVNETNQDSQVSPCGCKPFRCPHKCYTRIHRDFISPTQLRRKKDNVRGLPCTRLQPADKLPTEPPTQPHWWCLPGTLRSHTATTPDNASACWGWPAWGKDPTPAGTLLTNLGQKIRGGTMDSGCL